jgi:ABC-2 type transport system permease protein
MQRLLVTPTARAALVAGKGFIRSLWQGVIVYLLSRFLGVMVNWNFFELAKVVFAQALFSTFSLITACIIRSSFRSLSLGQLFTMPLLFASDAIYSPASVAGWLVSYRNPLTYVGKPLRTFMLDGSFGTLALGREYAAILLTTTILFSMGAWLRPHLAS